MLEEPSVWSARYDPLIEQLVEQANTPITPTDVPAALPVPASGQYMFTCSDHAAATSSSLLDNVLRVGPWIVDQPVSIDRIGAEVSSAGTSGRKFRIGVYADNGNRYPGALLLDAGQIAGDAVAVAELTANLTLPRGLYWVGGVVQSAGGTAPTMRTTGSGWCPPVRLPLGSNLPAANAAGIGYQQTGVSAALPDTFTTTVAPSTLMPRTFVRLRAA